VIVSGPLCLPLQRVQVGTLRLTVLASDCPPNRGLKSAVNGLAHKTKTLGSKGFGQATVV
jgi:hypothetical protein